MLACVTLNKNIMYGWYHTGAFGKDGAKWSCCCAEQRESQGCRRTTAEHTQRSRHPSLSTQCKWEHGSPSLLLEPLNKNEEYSTSFPGGQCPAFASSWGDENVQDDMYELLIVI